MAALSGNINSRATKLRETNTLEMKFKMVEGQTSRVSIFSDF
jgi:hypothetical protein